MITVIIPTYKRSKYLERAINSVLNQTYNDIEIIVVDDNNNDEFRQDTEKIMARYGGYENIIYIQHEKNLGGCAARNTGIKLAKGEFIACLDDDDIWLKDFLEKTIKTIGEDINIAAAYSSYYIGNEESVFFINKHEELYEGEIFEKLLGGWCPASTSFFLLRKSCVEQVGYFDEKLVSFQDYDLWLRLAKKFKIKYVRDRLVVKFEGANEQITGNPYKREKGLQSIENKWCKLLDKNEIALFESFLKKHKRYNEVNKIVYDKGNNQTYLKECISFMKKSSNKMRIFLLYRILLHSKMGQIYEKYKFKIFRRKYTIIDRSTIDINY